MYHPSFVWMVGTQLNTMVSYGIIEKCFLSTYHPSYVWMVSTQLTNHGELWDTIEKVFSICISSIICVDGQYTANHHGELWNTIGKCVFSPYRPSYVWIVSSTLLITMVSYGIQQNSVFLIHVSSIICVGGQYIANHHGQQLLGKITTENLFLVHIPSIHPSCMVTFGWLVDK